MTVRAPTTTAATTTTMPKKSRCFRARYIFLSYSGIFLPFFLSYTGMFSAKLSEMFSNTTGSSTPQNFNTTVTKLSQPTRSTFGLPDKVYFMFFFLSCTGIFLSFLSFFYRYILLSFLLSYRYILLSFVFRSGGRPPPRVGGVGGVGVVGWGVEGCLRRRRRRRLRPLTPTTTTNATRSTLPLPPNP